MPHLDQPAISDTEVVVHIRVGRNGVYVSGERQGRDPIGYTYDTLDEAMKEVPSVVDVLKNGGEKPTIRDRKEDLMREEDAINRQKTQKDRNVENRKPYEEE